MNLTYLVMKKLILLLVCFTFSIFMYGQSPFGPKKSISTNTGSFPRVIDSGHLNNDSFADIVIGTDLGGTIEWYKNNGNRTFTLQPHIVHIETDVVVRTLPRPSPLDLHPRGGRAAIHLVSDSHNHIL
jgi:hypothetical protein